MAVNCGERGLLLSRVRDESQVTLAAYRTVYESSIAFGIRKALQGEKCKTEMKKRVKGIYLPIVNSILECLSGKTLISIYFITNLDF